MCLEPEEKLHIERGLFSLIEIHRLFTIYKKGKFANPAGASLCRQLEGTLARNTGLGDNLQTKAPRYLAYGAYGIEMRCSCLVGELDGRVGQQGPREDIALFSPLGLASTCNFGA